MKSKRGDIGYPLYDSWPHPKPPIPSDDEDDETQSTPETMSRG